jgi:hypothetical protein
MTDIYQSPGDRLRFEILLKSLTEGSINLAVLSERDIENSNTINQQKRGLMKMRWTKMTQTMKTMLLT